MEKQLLSALVTSRESFDRLRSHLDASDLSDQGAIIYGMLTDYYDRDKDAAFCDTDLLRTRIEREYPKTSDILLHCVNNIQETSSINVETEFLAFKKGRIEQDLSHAFGAGDAGAIDELLAQYQVYNCSLDSAEHEEVYIGEDVQRLLSTVSPENLIKVYPKVLNERLGGGVPRGSHLLVYARPEQGKTAFAINMACGFANKGRRVLYVGNEEPYNMMLLRVISRLAAMPRWDVQKAPQEAMELAVSRGYRNIVFASLSPGSMADVAKLTDRHEVDVVIIDQLHNLRSKVQNKVERLEQQAKQARDLGHSRQCVVVSLTQAADSAEGYASLGMGDVYYSNTGIQGHVDIMIGIGSDEDMQKMDKRMLSLVKNKWTGNHTPCIVRLDRMLSKVTSI